MSNTDVDGAVEHLDTLAEAAFQGSESLSAEGAEVKANRVRQTIRNLRERLEVQDEKLSALCDCGDHVATAMFCPVHDTENWRNVEEDYSRLARELHAARRRADRLEEAEEERERLKRKVNKWIFRRSAARRRADRLEEAVRETVGDLRKVMQNEFDLTGTGIDALANSIDRLRSALDSREDEVKGPDDCLCTWELVSPADSSHDRTRRVETHPDCPVHADEPEGDEKG